MPMNRVRCLLSILVATSALACATTAPALPTKPAHRMGAVNNGIAPPCETLTLSNATVHTAGRLTLTVDTLSFNVDSTGTASGTWTLEESADGSTNWKAVTLPSSPPAAAGSAQSFAIAYDWWEFPYERLTFTGTGGTGSATVCTLMRQ